MVDMVIMMYDTASCPTKLESRRILALQAAVRNVIDEHARVGLPLHIWADGEVVEMSAKELRSSSRRPSSAKINRSTKAR